MPSTNQLVLHIENYADYFLFQTVEAHVDNEFSASIQVREQAASISPTHTATADRTEYIATIETEFNAEVDGA